MHVHLLALWMTLGATNCKWPCVRLREDLNETWKDKCVCVICIEFFLSQAGHIIISSPPEGFREGTTCADTELVRLDLPPSDNNGREIKYSSVCWKCRTTHELQTCKSGVIILLPVSKMCTFFCNFFLFWMPMCLCVWVHTLCESVCVRETQRQDVTAETGSLVKCRCLQNKPAGISGLSTCQDPWDQPVARRLQGERLWWISSVISNSQHSA